MPLTYGDNLSPTAKIVAPCLPKSDGGGFPFFPTTKEVVLHMIVQTLIVLYTILFTIFQVINKQLVHPLSREAEARLYCGVGCYMSAAVYGGANSCISLCYMTFLI